MNRKLGFAAAGVMATLGVLLVFLYLRDNRTAVAAPTQTPVAATVDLAPSEEPAEPTVEIIDDPLSDETIEAANGSLVAVTEDNRIIETGDPVLVPSDFLQLSFTLPTDRALGGRVRPGDTVAIVVSFANDPAAADNAPVSEDDSGAPTLSASQTTDVLLHKALVTDVQVQDVLGATTTSAGLSVEVIEGALNFTNSQQYTISIAVPSTQVERLVYAIEYGSIWLASQPTEAGETTNGLVTIDNIHQEVSIFINRDDLATLASDADADDSNEDSNEDSEPSFADRLADAIAEADAKADADADADVEVANEPDGEDG